MRWHKFIFLLPVFLPLATSGDTPVNGADSLLAKADRLAMLYNWPEAASLYSQAESLFLKSDDQTSALSSRLGYVWATWREKASRRRC